ncbi:MAG: hypothetical protein R2838_21185 [Caldilineaceae bacterium]
MRSGCVTRSSFPAAVAPPWLGHFWLRCSSKIPLLAALRQRAEFLGTVTFELTEFPVVRARTDVGAHFDGRLTYHACCHLLRRKASTGSRGAFPTRST